MTQRRLAVAASVALSVALSVVATACATSSSTTPAQETAQETAPSDAFSGLWRNPQDPRIYAWVSSPWTFSTTSWAIEGDDGLVLIDTQFLPKDAVAFVDAVEAATGKQAKVAVVLHANPDKFNGTAALQARGIKVVTSSQVKGLIPDVHKKRSAAFGERYAPDYPKETPAPESFGSSPTTVSDVAGVKLVLTPVGKGCSEAHVVASFDDGAGRHIFAGDLLANGAHAWLEIGEPIEWLKRLDEVDTMKPAYVHPGRGLSSDAALINVERKYLGDVMLAVSTARALGGDDDAVIADARRRILEMYPDLRFAVFLNIGLPAELARQKAQAAANP